MRNKLASLFIFSLLFLHEAAAGDLVGIDQYQSLVSDSKGNVIGESVTVLIVEDLRAETGSRSDLANNMTLGFQVGLNSDYQKQGSVGAGLGRDGGGVKNRRTSINSQLTATIIAADEYGRLQIEGSQYLSINGEEQTLNLHGWVRKEDIASDNTVLSTRLSDAQIRIESKGDTEDAAEPGVIYRVLSYIGLI